MSLKAKNTEIHVSKVLGGNPSLYFSLFAKLKEKTEVVAVEDVEEILGEKIKEIQSSLEKLDSFDTMVLRNLSAKCQKQRIKWVHLSVLGNLLDVDREKLEEGLKDSRLKNFLQIHQRSLAFQNNLIRYASEQF